VARAARPRTGATLDADGLPVLDEAMSAAWCAEARAHGQPSSEEWVKLVVQLRHAAEIGRGDKSNPNLPPAMTASEYAMRAVVAFLQPHPAIRRHGADQPLTELLGAIGDLAVGLVSPMFRPKQKPAHRPPVGQVDAMLMAMAASAVSLLMQTGERRNTATQRVASTLGEEPSTVLDWRARILKRKRVPALAIEHYWAKLPPEYGDTKAEQAANLLRWLEQFGAHLHAREEKGTNPPS
jgi:hypothetical protein